MDNKIKIKHILNKCDAEKYLSRNDLEGFYKEIYEEFGDPLTSSDIT